MIRPSGRVGCLVCVAVLAAAVAGCRDNPYATADVSGTVLCDGKPAYGGVIRFRPKDTPGETGRQAGHPGRNAFATVEEDGTFTMLMDTAQDIDQASGALIGQHEVFWEPPRSTPWRPTGEDRQNMTPAELEEYQRDVLDKLPYYPAIPCGRENSPKEVEVKPGENEFEFTLGPG